MMRFTCCLAGASLLLTLAAAGTASAVPITYTDLATYEAAVGAHPIIEFTEVVVNPGDILYDQYQDEGVIFLDGEVIGNGDDDVVMASAGFLADAVGVDANGSIEIEFTESQLHVGVEFPGWLRIELFEGATPVWTSAGVGDFGGPGLGHFGGVVSDLSFNRVILSDPADGSVYIDNLHYDVVPEPSAIFSLGFGCLAMVTCRRRDRELR